MFKTMSRMVRAIAKGVAVMLGPAGAPIEVALFDIDAMQSDRIEEAVNDSLEQEKVTNELLTEIRNTQAANSDLQIRLQVILEVFLSALLQDSDGRIHLQRVFLTESEDEVEALSTIIVNRVAVVTTKDDISKKLRAGIRQSYSSMHDLWADIEDDDFDSADFPHDAKNVQVGASIFVNLFWRQEPAVQRSTLATLARRNPTIPEFRDAMLGHALLIIT